MKKLLAILFILLVLFVVGIWFFYFRGRKNIRTGPRPVPIAVSKHSDLFNYSIEDVLNAYYRMTDGFVSSDTTIVNKYNNELVINLDRVKMDELKKDTAKDADKIYLTALDFIANAKSEATTILQQPSWDKKREGLNALTDDLRNLLITIKYDRGKIYYGECRTAFPNEIPGYWLSSTNVIHSPYPGTAGECGSLKDSIDFMAKDTTGKPR
ncbi:MAG: hypothetical protein Q8941_21740 [Bacteroidota bacterium]|nr:hypothetical protein [Bacteroidota bacterium]